MMQVDSADEFLGRGGMHVDNVGELSDFVTEGFSFDVDHLDHGCFPHEFRIQSGNLEGVVFKPCGGYHCLDVNWQVWNVAGKGNSLLCMDKGLANG